MPRFVILEHDHPVRHWDLMLERGGILRTWQLLREPDMNQAVPAKASFEHRLLYLDYEGPVSGDRGTVCQWDRGELTWTLDTAEAVSVLLEGQKLRGRGVLTLVSGDEWQFRLEPIQ